MKDYRHLLQNASESGVYRLNCPVEDLRDSVESSGFLLFDADITDAQGKGEVLAVLARTIQAPEWFGHNWDALADALGDLSWKEAPGYVLLLKGAKFAPDDYETLNSILKATVSFWKLQGKAFWVFFA
ncbi:MAG: barstar family protein [Nitrosomonadales bacterium]|nr:barstar family protein [Nitrosomonadales bacterium]